MPTTRLSKEGLRKLGAELGFHLEGEELEAVDSVMADFAAGFDFVKAMPEVSKASVPSRSHHVPATESNPNGAWVCQTTIRERDEGLLEGRTVAVKTTSRWLGFPWRVVLHF